MHQITKHDVRVLDDGRTLRIQIETVKDNELLRQTILLFTKPLGAPLQALLDGLERVLRPSP